MFDQSKYIKSFSDEAYDRITILVPKGSKRAIQQAAQDNGLTTSRYIVNFLPRALIGDWRSDSY